MIQMQTVLDVADNSGDKKVACIKVLGGTKKRYATIGDVIVVSVKEAVVNSKVKKGEVGRAVIVRTRRELKRPDGSYIKFDTNSAVMVSKEGEPIGTRIFGPVARWKRRLKRSFLSLRASSSSWSTVMARRSPGFIVVSKTYSAMRSMKRVLIGSLAADQDALDRKSTRLNSSH